jgi:hypothetical protein
MGTKAADAGEPKPAVHLVRRLITDGAQVGPDHLADLRKSGLTDQTINLQRFRSIGPTTVKRLLGFSTKGLDTGLLIPFPDPRGGFTDHIRVKVFPTLQDAKGHSIKYLQPPGSDVRLFFPLVCLREVCEGDAPLWLVEGEKKSLAAAQLGLPAAGFCGIEGWHASGSTELVPDFDQIKLADRVVELVPDGDVQTNAHVRRGAERLALALARRGARPRLVVLPERLP